MAKVNYIVGDATNPQTKGNKIIVHVCNDIGGWGKGFVLAISKRWKQPEQQYRAWFKLEDNFSLGQVQFVQVEEDLWVANLIGQHTIMLLFGHLAKQGIKNRFIATFNLKPLSNRKEG
jgi:O-acetyl-ADP-ribose deacetylase (regulator of RNase III)